MSQPPLTPQHQAPPPQKPNTLGLVSMILGILSLLVLCGGCVVIYAGYVSPALGLVAMVVGVMARREIAAGRQSGGGMAIAGIICGVFALVLFAFFMILSAAGIRALDWVQRQVEEAERQLEEMERQQQEQPETEPAGPATMLRMYGRYALAMLRIG